MLASCTSSGNSYILDASHCSLYSFPLQCVAYKYCMPFGSFGMKPRTPNFMNPNPDSDDGSLWRGIEFTNKFEAPRS